MKVVLENKESQEINKLVRLRVKEVMRMKVTDLDVDDFRNHILQCKVGMEYLRDIDLAHRIKMGQVIRIVNSVEDDPKKRKKLIDKSI